MTLDRLKSALLLISLLLMLACWLLPLSVGSGKVFIPPRVSPIAANSNFPGRNTVAALFQHLQAGHYGMAHTLVTTHSQQWLTPRLLKWQWEKLKVKRSRIVGKVYLGGWASTFPVRRNMVYYSILKSDGTTGRMGGAVSAARWAMAH